MTKRITVDINHFSFTVNSGINASAKTKISNTVKPVLSDHLWDKENMSLQDR